MRSAYFPDPIFAWIFFSVLMGFLLVATYTDQTRMRVPKWLTLPLLAVGLLANLIRGCGLALAERPGLLGDPTTWYGGAFDGLLFALIGFAVGFALFFFLWILGVCGGGDVKLFAALGSWVGPNLTVWILAGTLVFLAIYMSVRVVGMVFSGKLPDTRSPDRFKPQGDRDPRTGKTLFRYSLAVTVVSAVMLLWVYRVDLQLASPKVPAQSEAHAHAR